MLGSWSIGKKDHSHENRAPKEPVANGSGATEISEESDKAYESLARVLRCLGRHAFALDQLSEEDIEKEFERWARHVLVGTQIDADDSKKPEAGPRRDWGALTQFVNGHRQQEKSYVTRNLQDMRTVLCEFTNIMGRAFVEDQETDQKVTNHLVQLRTATEDGSFHDVKQALLAVVEGISALVDERKERQQQRLENLGEKLRLVEEELGGARKQMTLDALTQLYNRGALDLQLERTAGMSFFSGTSACILMVDIDHFKLVNDTYGHPAGDVVLQQVAKRLVSTFPRKTDFIARYGGEEFCVLLQGADGKLSQRLGERLLDAVRGEGFSYQDITIPVTASVGLAELLPGETVLSWLERADRALYRAKDNGRNQLYLATA
ncbi:GGDEF domain-containing protein [Candidatus Nitrospira neomarina]|uniref:diguanylate cyclase n=1 Tax=Candidatus Nitrospira neomarina TaxID=3020899 RepID=A0AA96GR95_9BACT|nr:GGDEF domain-containing protein [Candidatus Nitrospira neomarina]WNM63828.1 GGDEF domain-containing protein [Candidatus Nitrospira neomarina]